LSDKYYLSNRQIPCCNIMRFQLWIAHNSVSTNTGVQLQHSLWGSISTSKICVNIYDAMIFTDRHRICWIFVVGLSCTCFILKTLFICANQEWCTSNNVILSKLHENVKIQSVFCGHSSERKIQNISPPVYYISSKNCQKWCFVILTGNVSNLH
jgi:hypothetical protein